jgi:hypothetical protein
MRKRALDRIRIHLSHLSPASFRDHLVDIFLGNLAEAACRLECGDQILAIFAGESRPAAECRAHVPIVSFSFI